MQAELPESFQTFQQLGFEAEPNRYGGITNGIVLEYRGGIETVKNSRFLALVAHPS